MNLQLSPQQRQQWPAMALLENAGFQIEAGRLERALSEQSMPRTRADIRLHGPTVSATVKGRWTVEIDLFLTRVVCDCPDWTGGNGRRPGRADKRLCKHVLACLACLDTLPAEMAPVAATRRQGEPAEEKPDPPSAFRAQLRTQIAVENGRLLAWITAQYARRHPVTGAPPALYVAGPVGCGKTYAADLWAAQADWSIETEKGNESWAPSDILGLDRDAQHRYPGVLGRAFRRARAGERVLLVIDELPRFNAAVQAVFLAALEVVDVEAAQRRSLYVAEPVHVVRAPLWQPDDPAALAAYGGAGMDMAEWAPVRNLRWLFTGNPWGAGLDPAFQRRVLFKRWGFAQAVADLLSDRVKTAVVQSWTGARNRVLPSPLDYGALLWATGPDDTGVVLDYLERLRVADEAGAEAFAVQCQSWGIEPPEEELI